MYHCYWAISHCELDELVNSDVGKHSINSLNMFHIHNL